MKLSIQDALNELKLIDKKLDKTYSTYEPFGYKIIKEPNVRVVGSSVTYDEKNFKKEAKSSYQSITKLMSNRYKIKAAILKSNTETLVTVGKETMTVAEAIDRKQVLEKYEGRLCDYLVSYYGKVNKEIVNHNERVENKLETLVNGLVGNAKETTKYSAEISSLKKLYEVEKAELIASDDKFYEKVVVQLGEDNITFLSQVDNALTRSNVLTEIEVDLD